MNLCLATSFKLFILAIFINLSVLAIIDFAYAVHTKVGDGFFQDDLL